MDDEGRHEHAHMCVCNTTFLNHLVAPPVPMFVVIFLSLQGVLRNTSRPHVFQFIADNHPLVVFRC